MTLCTRHLEPAIPFAIDYELSLKDRAELQNWHTYDGVISATTSALSQKFSEQFQRQSPYNRRSQVHSYCINTDELA